MSPVYRIKSEPTTHLAEIPEGLTERELVRVHKAQLKKDLEELATEQAAERKRRLESAAASLVQSKARLKESRSKKTLAQQEKDRKARIRKARRQAEYDIYRQIMAEMAVSSALPLDRAHDRAVAFAEHIIRHSPAGHEDVGYVG